MTHPGTVQVTGVQLMLMFPDRLGAGRRYREPVQLLDVMPTVLEVAGVRDILTKSQGSANVLNVVQATFDALEQLKSPQKEAARRGKNVSEVLPFWERRKQNA